jgi:hypothetical protein
MLKKYLGIFNGQMIVTIATGEHHTWWAGPHKKFSITTGFVDPKIVEEEFGEYKDRITFVHAPNHEQYGESPHFLPMLRRVASLDPNEITFYAHAKGVRYPVVGTPRMRNRRIWTRSMYYFLLSMPHITDAFLDKYDSVGCYRACGFLESPLKVPLTHPFYKRWHYAGTFFWLKNSAVFGNRNWNAIHDYNRGAVEAYPGGVVDIDRSYDMISTPTHRWGYPKGLWKDEHWNEAFAQYGVTVEDILRL